MNKYDEKYDIKLAERKNISEIMEFIRDNWNKDHILGNCLEFFEYEHVIQNHVNFIIAIDKKTHIMEGIYGYIQASLDEEHKDVWGVMWMIRNDTDNIPFLGIELIKRLKQLINCRSVIGIGSNPKTAIPIIKLMLRYHTGKMQHFYMLNSKIENFKIAVVNESKDKKKHSPENKDIKCSLLSSIDEIIAFYNPEKNKEMTPYKDIWYIEHRYINHPVYEYLIYGISNKEIEAILIMKRVGAEGRTVLRVVDYLGSEKLIAGLGNWLNLQMDDTCEYIDFYCYGFDKECIKNAGFVLRNEADTNIIPNYFEPFVQENIDIYVDSPLEDTKFCKADGDQDRPNFFVRKD